jgi:hypothetical protein
LARERSGQIVAHRLCQLLGFGAASLELCDVDSGFASGVRSNRQIGKRLGPRPHPHRLGYVLERNRPDLMERRIDPARDLTADVV